MKKNKKYQFQEIKKTFSMSTMLIEIWPWRFYDQIGDEFNPIQYGSFQGCSKIGGSKKAPLPKICHTYPTMVKIGTVISYLQKIQKIYESRDTPLEFCWD